MEIRKKNKREKGQSTIEFILCFAIVIGFIFSFLKLAVVYTNGFLVHYAVFQASRAYMVVETGSNQPQGSDRAASDEAKKVFEKYPLSSLISNFDSDLVVSDPESNGSNERNLYIGLRLKFNQSISIPGSNTKIDIPFITESYLGKEPTRAECFESICNSFKDLPGVGDCPGHSTVADNGC